MLIGRIKKVACHYARHEGASQMQRAGNRTAEERGLRGRVPGTGKHMPPHAMPQTKKRHAGRAARVFTLSRTAILGGHAASDEQEKGDAFAAKPQN